MKCQFLKGCRVCLVARVLGGNMRLILGGILDGISIAPSTIPSTIFLQKNSSYHILLTIPSTISEFF